MTHFLIPTLLFLAAVAFCALPTAAATSVLPRPDAGSLVCPYEPTDTPDLDFPDPTQAGVEGIGAGGVGVRVYPFLTGRCYFKEAAILVT